MSRSPLLLLAALFLILIGARAALIGYAGNPTPFLDEWDGDAAQLLIPYLQGRLTPGDLFAPFAEHRIFFTRLLVLSTLHVSGYWDVVLQMIVNAIVDAATIVAISYGLTRVLKGDWAVAALLVCALVNVVPFAYETVLFGFHTQFFALKAFSFASLWLLVGARAWSPRWAIGVVAAVAAYFSMASGALTAAAALATYVPQAACGRRAGLREIVGAAALIAMTVAMVAFIPDVPAPAGQDGRSIAQFFSSLVRLASWPAGDALGLIFYAPSVVFVARALRDRPALGDPRWLNIAALAWVAGQMVAIAAARGEFPIQSRYTHVLVLGLMLNLVSAVWWLQSTVSERRPALWRPLAFAAWLGLLLALLLHPQRRLPQHIEDWRTIMTAGAENVRQYLTTGDPSFILAPTRQIPYVDAGRLRELLDAPEIRAALPPELTAREPPRPGVELFKRGILGLSSYGFGLGFLVLAAVLARAALMRKRVGAWEGKRTLRPETDSRGAP